MMINDREKQQLEDEKHDHPVKKDNEEHLRAVICVCRRFGSDTTLLWLWHRQSAAALI